MVLFLLHAVLDKDMTLFITVKFYSIRAENNKESYSNEDMCIYMYVHIHMYVNTSSQTDLPSSKFFTSLSAV